MVKTSTFRVTLKRFVNGEVVIEMTSGNKIIESSFGKADKKWNEAFNAVAKIIKKK